MPEVTEMVRSSYLPATAHPPSDGTDAATARDRGRRVVYPHPPGGCPGWRRSGEAQPSVAGEHYAGDEPVLDQSRDRVRHVLRAAVAADRDALREPLEHLLPGLRGHFVPPA